MGSPNEPGNCNSRNPQGIPTNTSSTHLTTSRFQQTLNVHPPKKRTCHVPKKGTVYFNRKHIIFSNIFIPNIGIFQKTKIRSTCPGKFFPETNKQPSPLKIGLSGKAIHFWVLSAMLVSGDYTFSIGKRIIFQPTHWNLQILQLFQGELPSISSSPRLHCLIFLQPIGTSTFQTLMTYHHE